MQSWTCLFCPETYGTHEELTGHIFAEHQAEMADLRAVMLKTLETAARLEELARRSRGLEYEAAVRHAFAARRN